MDDFHTPGESHQDELWLVSYADMLTLLIGFFVLIVAAVPLRKAVFERIAASISGAKAAPLQNLRQSVDDLVARTPALRDRVVARDDAEGLGIEFKDALLFDSGSAEVRSEGRKAIAEVAKLLLAVPGRPVVVEGHTDEVPIRTARFGSNWELSSQRAINVLAALESNGVERSRMSARAYADTRPREVQGNVDDRRLANRRVVIRVE
ncbi:MAG: flagellar motor protein MotB [Deltaproteobacteria bacterium]|nr:MAG: flagellar motor protein MotB [Deltaproteobacteria bacterium]